MVPKDTAFIQANPASTNADTTEIEGSENLFQMVNMSGNAKLTEKKAQVRNRPLHL